MLKKAGYVQAGRRVALDGDGQENSIIEVYIYGTRFAVRLPELYQAMAGIKSGRIEPVQRVMSCVYAERQERSIYHRLGKQ